MVSDNRKTTKLLVKALLNELSEEEQHYFNTWLLQSDGYQQLWTKIQKKGFIGHELSDLNAVDTEASYRQFLQQRKGLRIRKLMQYVAVVLPFCIFLGWCIQQFLVDNIWQIGIVEKKTEEIVSGKMQARLFLSDGKEYELGEKEVRLQEGKVNVIVVGGKLQYENTDEEQCVKYNTLQVPRGGEYVLALSDGSIAYLNAGSWLKYPVCFTGDTRDVQVSGEVYFEIAPDSLHPFRVHTKSLDVRVLGTKFNLTAYPEDESEKVTLVYGAVAIQGENQEIILKPDEQLIFEKQAKSVQVKQIDAKKVSAWTKGILYFEEMPLEELTEKLGRWFDCDFLFSSEELKHLTFSGAFRKYNDIDYIFSILEATADIKIKRENRIMIIDYK